MNFEERKQRIDNAISLGEEDELRPIDKITKESDEWWSLPLMQQELILEADDPDFQGVINRMENKDPNIIKLRTVQELRRKVGKNSRKKLTRFEESREIIDSSLVIGALIIKRWIVERRERRKEKDKLKLRRMKVKRE